MNKQQRKEITDLVSRIEAFKSSLQTVLEEQKSVFQSIQSAIESLQQTEQDKYDNLPENMQYSEKGDHQQEIADRLQDAVDACDDIDLDLELDIVPIIEALEEARDL